MNLAEIQTNVRTAILAHPSLSAATVVIDDGTGEKNQSRVAALKASGFSILVWRIESGGIVDASRTGTAIQNISIFVFLEEDTKVNRAEGGFGVQIENALTYVMAALSGARVGSERIVLDNPPFDNLGMVNGVLRILVSAKLQHTTVPING